MNNRLYFNYTIQTGDQTADLSYQSINAFSLNGCVITDAIGNNAETTLPAVGALNSLSGAHQLRVDTSIPVVSFVTSSNNNGLYQFGSTIAINVLFSESMQVVGGSPRLLLETGDQDHFALFSKVDANVMTFIYTVQENDVASDLDYASTTSLQLNGASIIDLAGNAANVTLATPGAAGSLGYAKNIMFSNSETVITSIQAITLNGTYIGGQHIFIEVAFDSLVDVNTDGGIPSILLETGANDRQAFYDSGSGTTLLTFKYTVEIGDATLDLNVENANALQLNGGEIVNLQNVPVSTSTPIAGVGSLSDASDISIDTSLVVSIDMHELRVVGDIGVCQVQFSPIANLSDQHIININFPSQYDISQAYTLFHTYTGNANLISEAVGNTLRITMEGLLLASDGYLLIDGVLANTASAADTIEVQIKDKNNNLLAVGLGVTPSIEITEQKPLIITRPLVSGIINSAYYYDVDATDPQDDTLLYSLDANALAAGLSIEATSGIITWLPSIASDQLVTVTVSDGSLIDTQSWTITFDGTELTNATFVAGASDFTGNYYPATNAWDDDLTTRWISAKKVSTQGFESLVFDLGGVKKLSEIRSIQVKNSAFSHASIVEIYIGTELNQISLYKRFTDVVCFENEWCVFSTDNVKTRYVKIRLNAMPNHVNENFITLGELKFFGKDDSSPYFNSTPTNEVVYGQNYLYTPSVINPSGEVLTYSINASALAAGVTVNSNTGEVSWLGDTINQAINIILEVQNTSGDKTTQSWVVKVMAPEISPLVIDSSLTDAAEHPSYPYINLFDNDDFVYWNMYTFGINSPDTKRSLVFDLGVPTNVSEIHLMPRKNAVSHFPHEINIYGAKNPDQFELLYTIDNLEATSGEWCKLSLRANEIRYVKMEMKVRVYDSKYYIQIGDLKMFGNPIQNPIILSKPSSTAIVNQPYFYQPIAQDGQGDTLTFSIDSKSEMVGFTVDTNTGLVSWLPGWDSAGHVVRLTVSDGTHYSTQTWSVLLEPTKLSFVVDEANSKYGVYKPLADMFDGDPVTYWSSGFLVDDQKIVFDLGDTYQLSNVNLIPRFNGNTLFPTELKFYVGNEVSHLTLVNSVTNYQTPQNVTAVFDLGNVVARYVRVDIDAIGFPESINQIQIGDIEIIGAYSNSTSIYSAPVKNATVGANYQYQVLASSGGSSNFIYHLDSASLLAGMNIDSATGLITWVPDQNSVSRQVTVYASNGESVDSQTWFIDVKELPLEVEVMIPQSYTNYFDKVMANAFDGDENTYWSSINWPDNTEHECVYLDLKKVTSLNKLKLLPRANDPLHFSKEIKIYVGNDPQNMPLVKNLTDVLAINGEWTTIDLSGYVGQFVLLEFTPIKKLGPNDWVVQFAEMEVYGTPTDDPVFTGSLYQMELTKNNEYLTLSWTGVEKGGWDWIGLYTIGSADDEAVWWTYIDKGKTGSITIVAPEKKIYEARYYLDSTWTKLATSPSVDVTFDGSYSLTVSSENVTVNDTITINWTAPANSAEYDWIGLYPDGAEDWDFTWWIYTGGAAAGSTTLQIPDAGTYHLRYGYDNRLIYKATSATITVTE